MPTMASHPFTTIAARDTIAISALNQFAYCERRAYLIHVEGVFVDNEHTLMGTLVHETVDIPGFEQRAGWEVIRALPIYSDTFGIIGKADLIEVLRDSFTRRIVAARPVEYKKGKARRWFNDQLQVCAQALCLEEMFGLRIDSGLIYHAASCRRDEVMIDAPLRNLTLATLDSLRATMRLPSAPEATLKPQCEGCSLHEVCLPEATSDRRMTLFEPRGYA